MKIRAHETFSIRKGWLHKGVRNVLADDRLFTKKDINPCDMLGIGSNMVKALRYWLIATGITEEILEGSTKRQVLTELGQTINNNDEFYEEDGTKWAVHYKLATNKDTATAWYWFYNIFKLNSFDKHLFVQELGEYIKLTFYGTVYSEKVLGDEFDCIMKTYCSKERNIDPEDNNVCPLTDLHLIVSDNGKDYKKNVPDKMSLPPLIIFGAICDQNQNDEILITDLMNKEKNIAKIFNLDRSTCFYCLDQLQKMGYLEMSRTAGLDVIHILHRMSFVDALQEYYYTLSGGRD